MTAMHCHHCENLMEQTDSVQEGGTRQTWFRCPLCGAEQTIAEPAPSTCQRLGDRLRWCTTQSTPAGYAVAAIDARQRSPYRKA